MRELARSLALLAAASFISAAAIAQGVQERAAPNQTPSREPTPIAEPPARAPAKMASFDRSWFYKGQDDSVWRELARGIGKPAKSFKVREWLGEERTLESMRGKIVVIDFWGTWCGPCLRAMPHNNELYERYNERGVEFIGICDGRKGAERAQEVLDRYEVQFPNAIDQDRATYQSYSGQWFPFIILIDRNGNLRAKGLTPPGLESAIEALLEEQPDEGAHQGRKRPPRFWLEGNQKQRATADALQGQPPPPLTVSRWINTEPIAWADLEGKVVLVDFWGTWCGKCLRATPKLIALQEKYADRGLVVVGVCDKRKVERMEEVVEKLGMPYPIAADESGKTFADFGINGTPDYYIIDRSGVLRFADVSNDHIEAAVVSLLEEES